MKDALTIRQTALKIPQLAYFRRCKNPEPPRRGRAAPGGFRRFLAQPGSQTPPPSPPGSGGREGREEKGPSPLPLVGGPYLAHSPPPRPRPSPPPASRWRPRGRDPFPGVAPRPTPEVSAAPRPKRAVEPPAVPRQGDISLRAADWLAPRMNGRGGFGLSHVFLRRCEKKNRMKRVERRPYDQVDRTKDPSARIFPPLQKTRNPPPPPGGGAVGRATPTIPPEVSHTPRGSPEPRQGRPRRLSQIFGPAGTQTPPPSPPGSGGSTAGRYFSLSR